MTQELNAAGTCYCNESSLQAGEQLFGSAPHADVWLLLEFRDAWSAKAITDNDLTAAVRARLTTDIEGRTVRTQLLRQPGRTTDGIGFFVAVVDPAEPRLYAFHLTAYEELLDLDLAGITAGDIRYDSNRSRAALFLLCTNGRRDIACARFGLPVYQALAVWGGESVWQTTHLGGHRFAATGVSLPDGIVYGRLAVADVPVLWDAHRQRRIAPAFYRGRSCWPQPIQAAEYFLRQETGIDTLPGFRLEDAVPKAGGRWVVRFAAIDGGAIATVQVREEPDALQVILSSAEMVPTAVPQFRLEAMRGPGD